MRRLAPVLLVTTLMACAHAPPSGPISLRSDTVKEEKSELVYELSYEPKGARKLEIVLRMRVNGLVETNKLVAETYIRFFNVEDGNTRWEGFVPPRQPQTFRVLLSMHEGAEEATVTVMLSRSHDSLSLLKEELTFVADANGVVKPKG